MTEYISILQGYIDHLEYMNKFAYSFFDREQANKDIEAFKAAIKALEQESCDTCEHSDEINGSNCYECVKGIRDRYNPQPCEDAISRRAVLDYIHRILNQGTGKKKSFDFIQKYVEKLPPVNPQSKTGHWVEENINEWSREVFCSECDCPPPFEHISNGDIYSAGGYGVTNKTKFCPNCGAKMSEIPTGSEPQGRKRE